MLVFRFANGIFEPIWNRQYIDHVQITVAEAIGVEGRGGFYEPAGVIRDIVQNHLLQLLALTAMEPPIAFTAEAVRDEKVKVLRSLHTPGPKSVVRGQYGRGFVEGEEVPAYREEPDVAPDSMIETYVATKLFVDNWRWADMPFYVRAGKRLARRVTTIAIQFKRVPHPLFEETADGGAAPNVLLVHIQPDEGIALALDAKEPGQGMIAPRRAHGLPLRRRVPHEHARGVRAAAARRDARRGDAVHARDEVEEQWLLIDAIVAGWQRDRPGFPNYAAGTWGPPSADDLLQRDGRSRRHARVRPALSPFDGPAAQGRPEHGAVPAGGRRPGRRARDPRQAVRLSPADPRAGRRGLRVAEGARPPRRAHPRRGDLRCPFRPPARALAAANRRHPASSVAPVASGYERSLRPCLAWFSRARASRRRPKGAPHATRDDRPRPHGQRDDRAPAGARARREDVRPRRRVAHGGVARGAGGAARRAARLLADDPRREDHRGRVSAAAHDRGEGRHDRRRRQLELPGLAAPLRRGAGEGDPLRRRRRLRRHLGAEGRLLPDGRRRGRAGEAARAGVHVARAGRRLRARRRVRRRATS